MEIVTKTTVTKTTVTVQLADGGWATQELDTIEIEGGYWLVPHWTLSPDQSKRQPLRLVSMTMVETGGPCPDPEAFAGLPIPESLLAEGHIPLSLARLFLVREGPDMWLPNPGA